MDAIKSLVKQPYWIATLFLGVGLILAPLVTINKELSWSTHPPTTYIPVIAGAILLLVSFVAFAYTLVSKRSELMDGGGGLDLTRVKESKGAFATKVADCEVRVIFGRIEDQAGDSNVAVVLPCNEYFDDRCVGDTRGALGAFAKKIFEGQVQEFSDLVTQECKTRLKDVTDQEKTEGERAASYGAGRCILLKQPLGKSRPIALVSTTTQRAGQGLVCRISYLFDGMRSLVTCLADARINEVVLPVLGSGHGGVDPPLALVGLLLAIAEAARYGHASQRLKRLTVVVFKRNDDAGPDVEALVIRRTLALIGNR